MTGFLRLLGIAAVIALGLGYSAVHADSAAETNAAPRACRADENGARIVADRGIGGTGISGSTSLPPATSGRNGSSDAGIGTRQLADRGIGGTGISGHLNSTEDRGIGGTGIVGVITGFGSVCLDGLEVTYDPNASVNVDGSSESPDVLRAGQLAVVKAKSVDNSLKATALEIRHEVSGPVLDVQDGGRTLIVAGQRVAVPKNTWGNQGILAGDWIEVSGLRDENGEIAATRLDRRLPGTVMVRGVLTAGSGGPQIGSLAIVLPAGMAAAIDRPIQLTGRYADGALYVDSSAQDLFVSDPTAYFGADTTQYVVDSYVNLSAGFVRFGSHRALIEHDKAGSGRNSGRTIMQLRRADDGSMTATPMRSAAAPRGVGTGESIPSTPAEKDIFPGSPVPLGNDLRPQQKTNPGVPSPSSGTLSPFGGILLPGSPFSGSGGAPPGGRAPIGR